MWLLLACLGAPPTDPGPLRPEPSLWLERTAAGVVLQVAWERWTGPDGREVLLVGALHVAEPILYDVSLARLAEAEAVFVEGMDDDVAPRPPVQRVDVAEALGLSRQWERTFPESWRRVDPPESVLAQRMRADGLSEAEILEQLGPGPAQDVPIPSDERQKAIERLKLARALLEPSDDEIRKKYIIDYRNSMVMDEVLASGMPSVAVWYGVDHLPGMAERLHAAQFRRTAHEWTPAMVIDYSDLELGPVQVDQLLRR